MTPMTPDVPAICARLSPLDRERLTGWQGPAGAAYNAVSEDLREMGLLNADWSLSSLGNQCAHLLKEQQP